MTGARRSFDDLVGDVPPGAERERLRRAHELLLAAGPPPELSPLLERAPEPPSARVVSLVRRRRFTALAAAAVVAVVLFGAGYTIGQLDTSERSVQTLTLTGSGGARGSLVVYDSDVAGNWPMKLEVSGLEALPRGATYALWLTRDGKLADQCGTFVAGPTPTEVALNAPYRLKDYDGWVVVRAGSTQPFVLRTAAV